MSNAALSSQPGKMVDTVRAGWRWWSGELAALMAAKPPSITVLYSEGMFVVSRSSAGGPTEVLRVPLEHCRSAETLPAHVKIVKESTSGSEEVLLLLPHHWALRRTVE